MSLFQLACLVALASLVIVNDPVLKQRLLSSASECILMLRCYFSLGIVYVLMEHYQIKAFDFES